MNTHGIAKQIKLVQGSPDSESRLNQRQSLGSTQSLCPVCLSRIDATKVAYPEGIFLEKTCPHHGDFSTLIWEGDSESYLQWDRANTSIDTISHARSGQRNCPYDCGLCLEHKRQTCCVLLEVTSRCNLQCPVCFAAAGKGDDPALDEIAALYDILRDTGSTYNIQLSGGEPTLRDDLPEIIKMGIDKGFSFFQLNTNGIRLAEDKAYVAALAQAGLSCVFLQFDGVSENPYVTLRGKPLLEKKISAIDNCAEFGLGVVLVPTIAPSVNDGEIGIILMYAFENMPQIRGVHFQPITYMGRNALTPTSWRITIPYMLNSIHEQTKGFLKREDFIGGGAENSYCSFHATYHRNAEGELELQKDSGSSCCSVSSEQSRDSVARLWSAPQQNESSSCCGGTSSLDEFLEQRQRGSFAVSGMLFQDAYTLDLDRLKSCYICEVDKRYGLVPFCAYNLTGLECVGNLTGSESASNLTESKSASNLTEPENAGTPEGLEAITNLEGASNAAGSSVQNDIDTSSLSGSKGLYRR